MKENKPKLKLKEFILPSFIIIVSLIIIFYCNKAFNYNTRVVTDTITTTTVISITKNGSGIDSNFSAESNNTDKIATDIGVNFKLGSDNHFEIGRFSLTNLKFMKKNKYTAYESQESEEFFNKLINSLEKENFKGQSDLEYYVQNYLAQYGFSDWIIYTSEDNLSLKVSIHSSFHPILEVR